MSRIRRDQRGAAAVELALILPLVLMLALGIFFGGAAYNQKISLTQAARETVRYGATLYPDGGLDAWLDAIRDRAIESADGELDSDVPGRYICVAYVGQDPTNPDGGSVTRSLVDDSDGESYGGSWCFSDSRGEEGRVQARLGRDAEFNALLFKTTIALSSDALGRYELVPK